MTEPAFPIFGPQTPLPGEGQITALWDRYRMPPNIRRHSQAVCDTALQLAGWLVEGGVGLYLPALRAGALLHDIAKAPCLASGGFHDAEGRQLLVQHGYPELATLVGDHVDLPDPHPLDEAMVVYYADKRILHSQLVGLRERNEDLIVRYGQGNPDRIERLGQLGRRARAVERFLFAAMNGPGPEDVSLRSR